MRIIPALVLLSLALPGRAPAQPTEERYRQVFSVDALGSQPVSGSVVPGFTLGYRGTVPNAAFAIARDAAGRSAWAYVSGRPTPEAAAAEALGACQRGLGTLQAECRILARNGALAAGPAVPVTEGSIGPFRWSPLHLRRGPQAARGVLIWGHGYGGAALDRRNSPSPGFVSMLNDAGWDILRFDRLPHDDALYNALPRLIDGLAAVRAAGYRHLILGGQSRGGWQSIMAASARPDLVDAVIAIAPAAHGEWSRANNLQAGLDDFRRLLAGLPPSGPRLAIAVFDGDDYDPDPERRAGMLDAVARDRLVPTLALWPQAPAVRPIRGHDGGSDWRFTALYGACLLTLVQAPDAAAPRGVRRAPCGGG